MKPLDLSNKKFNRLTPIKICGKTKDNKYIWSCKCDCGNFVSVIGKNIKNGNTKSCGCLRKEQCYSNGKIYSTTHGLTKTKIYKIWDGMIQRCTNFNCEAYKNYGKREIIVCERWLKFENFYKDVGDPPKGLTLDRIDNNKGYFPDNWRWATRKEQANNRRNNHIIPYNDKKYNITELARKHNISPEILRYRLNRGQSTEDALTKPVRKYKKRQNNE